MKKLIAIIGTPLVLAFAPGSAPALPISSLEVIVQTSLHDLGGVGSVGGRIDDAAAAGPLLAELATGAVFTYDAPSFPPDALEATLFQTARARADYGTNAASVKSGLAATTAQDRGDFPSGGLIDLELGSSLSPEMNADSRWTDTFVIHGGSGIGTAIVSVELDGSVQSGYGENGTAFYDELSGTFEEFGRTGFGQLRYALEPRYDSAPIDFGPDGAPPVILMDEAFGNQHPFLTPLPDILVEIGVPAILTGEVLFEYGVPFALESSLSLNGFRQIDMDYFHTAALSLFTLPAGATLTSGSGHVYNVSSGSPPATVPEPGGVWLLASGLLALIGLRRRKGLRRE